MAKYPKWKTYDMTVTIGKRPFSLEATFATARRDNTSFPGENKPERLFKGLSAKQKELERKKKSLEDEKKRREARRASAYKRA
jgi:DeoR/GlpR family transcriptional regulator of sugar metabolism